MSLRQRGFFITPFGQLLANEGELTVETVKGVLYTLRFGEVVSDGISTKQRENRYVFITVASRNPENEALAKAMQNKFADWYYVISGADFAKLHPQSAAAKGEPPAPRLPPGFPPSVMRQQGPGSLPPEGVPPQPAPPPPPQR